jgi:hypothetical protein
MPLNKPRVVVPAQNAAPDRGGQRMKLAVAPALLAALLCALSAGCADPNAFDDGVAKAAAEWEPVQLDSEQVSMNAAQLTCGVNNDLWDAPRGGAERSISRLEQKGRALNFSDDVTSDEVGFMNPYTQVRGKFPLQLDRVVSTSGGEDKDTKIIQAKVGIKIAHACFDSPLPIMGVHKGQYSDALPVTLQYERDGNGWHLAKIIH